MERRLPVSGGGLPNPRAGWQEDPLMFFLAFTAAITSIAALLLHLADFIRMPYTLSFVTLPGMVILLGIRIRAGHAGRDIIVQRLSAGFVGGILGLGAYNLVRWIIGLLLAADLSPFYSIYIFGSLITGKTPNSSLSILFGWAYHISNGITFAIIYALFAGAARWHYGLLWGLALEVAMLAIYPSSTLLRPPALMPFVTISLAAHASYGVAIGLYVQRRCSLPATAVLR
ncbi:conserved membrane hypothetical protein [Arthrobacter sp. 9AX]|nr:conserved membrane hypothetical protein [Arthrobacter sp. 9AX]